MQGKIALEEHFAIDDTLMDSKGFFPTMSGLKCARAFLISTGDAFA